MQPLFACMSSQPDLISNIAPGVSIPIIISRSPSSRPTPADLSDIVSREDRFFRWIWRRRKREKIGGQIVEMGTIDKFNLFGRGWRRVKLEGGESLLGGEFVVVDSLGYFERKRRRGKASFIELRTFNIEPAAFIFGHALGNRRKIHSASGSWFRRKNREIINLPEGLIVSRTKLPLVLFPRFFHRYLLFSPFFANNNLHIVLNYRVKN